MGVRTQPAVGGGGLRLEAAGLVDHASHNSSIEHSLLVFGVSYLCVIVRVITNKLQPSAEHHVTHLRVGKSLSGRPNSISA